MSRARKAAALGAAAGGLYLLWRALTEDPIELAGQAVLITGGSRGLGLVLALSSPAATWRRPSRGHP